MKRTLLIIILLLIIAVMVLVWAWPAQAVTYSGGTPEHQYLAREIIESCRLDYQWIDARVEEVDVLFAEEYDPYVEEGKATLEDVERYMPWVATAQASWEWHLPYVSRLQVALLMYRTYAVREWFGITLADDE